MAGVTKMLYSLHSVLNINTLLAGSDNWAGHVWCVTCDSHVTLIVNINQIIYQLQTRNRIKNREIILFLFLFLFVMISSEMAEYAVWESVVYQPCLAVWYRANHTLSVSMCYLAPPRGWETLSARDGIKSLSLCKLALSPRQTIGRSSYHNPPQTLYKIATWGWNFINFDKW